ncbi:FUSC family protein [Sphingomonas endolithica]|uniref:FUSC family protein n=1 Tax=Sphingomonas endolithica TaxID=2972485 RepID=UPI0021AEC660|nr:FUSC family protein [Sphingomonas sp. ZFBP2030]
MRRLTFPAYDVPAFKQMFRVAAACAIAFAAYKMLGLTQGYWAVFTVLIVMQGSLGGTLGAAFDRMLGTLVGAGLGAVGALLHGDGAVGTGAALVLVTGLGTYLATLRPQLKIAPVTASIMMLTMPRGTPIADFVVDRIVEITLGGGIGVAAMALILPASSQAMVTRRAAEALDRMHGMIRQMADAVASGEAVSFAEPLVALRPALASIEQALKDADREHATWLSRHAIPPAIPRTLWRLRSDLVLVARALDPPFPDAVRAMLGTAGADLLRLIGDDVVACAAALRAGKPVVRTSIIPARTTFGGAFAAFRTSAEGNALTLDVAGHVFGLSFALDELVSDLSDVADRIDEMNGATHDPRSR